MEHDPFPGRCRLYVDTNQDGLCDHSQEEPKAKAKAVSVSSNEITNASSEEAGSAPSAPTLPQSRDLKSTSPKKPDRAPVLPETAKAELSAPVRPDAAPKPRPGHHPWEIMLAVTILALGTEIAIVRKKSLYLRLQTLWNWALLLSFLGCTATGIYFLFLPSLLPGSAVMIAAWHTDTGLAFIAIGLYHAIRRFPCMLRGLKSCRP